METFADGSGFISSMDGSGDFFTDSGDFIDSSSGLTSDYSFLFTGGWGGFEGGGDVVTYADSGDSTGSPTPDQPGVSDVHRPTGAVDAIDGSPGLWDGVVALIAFLAIITGAVGAAVAGVYESGATAYAWLGVAAYNAQQRLGSLWQSVANFFGSKGIAVDEAGAARVGDITFDAQQLQTKFKHAMDFGIEGNYNPENAAKFEQTLRNFVQNAANQIPGTYRGQPANFYVDPESALMVMTKPSGEFWSTWKLSADQVRYLLQTGKLGGG